MAKNDMHQTDDRSLTTRQGHPVTNKPSQRPVASRGPVPLENYHFLEKMTYLGRERIPERDAQARGFLCYGEFEATGRIGDEPASKYTRARIFEQGRKTPLAIRFSSVIGGRDSSEVARDPRGFEVKFATDDGSWVLAGNNLPVFFIRDAIKLPDVIHALTPDPVTCRQEPNRIFGFMSQTPESIHMLTFLFSPRGIPASYRHQQGFGVNAHKMVNAAGETVLVKYHWHPRSGVASLTAADAETVHGKDPRSASKDLFEAIERAEYPQWDLYVQIMEDHDHPDLGWDPLDVTKVWPENLFPLRHVGVMTLNRNVEDQHNEGEPITMDTGVLVDGLDLPDAHFEPNIPNELLDDKRVVLFKGPAINGHPSQTAIERRNDYVQARARYETMQGWERDDLVKNLSDVLARCERDVRDRMVWHFLMVHDDLGTRVGAAVGVSPHDVKQMPPLAGQVLTESDQARLRNLGSNGDTIDAKRWGTWTGSVPNTQATAEEVIDGMRTVSMAAVRSEA